MATTNYITAETITLLGENVFLEDLEQGVRLTRGGLILPDDDMSERGIHPRWGRVHSIGPKVTDLAVGEYVLVAHGRWTPGFDVMLAGKLTRLWRIDYPEGVLLVTENDPRTTTQITLT